MEKLIVVVLRLIIQLAITSVISFLVLLAIFSSVGYFNNDDDAALRYDSNCSYRCPNVSPEYRECKGTHPTCKNKAKYGSELKPWYRLEDDAICAAFYYIKMYKEKPNQGIYPCKSNNIGFHRTTNINGKDVIIKVDINGKVDIKGDNVRQSICDY